MNPKHRTENNKLILTTLVLLFLLLYPGQTNAQALPQTVSYQDVALKLPDDWHYKLEEVAPDLLYGISCMSNSQNGILLVQMNADPPTAGACILCMTNFVMLSFTFTQITKKPGASRIFNLNNELSTFT